MKQETPDKKLLGAVHDGDVKTAKIAINIGANVNYRDSMGLTPLHVAVQKDNVNLVKLLVDNGADLDRKDGFGDSPMKWAHGRGNDKVLSVLQEKVGGRDGFSGQVAESKTSGSTLERG